MKEFEKWWLENMLKDMRYESAYHKALLQVGWKAALEWMKKEAISLDERGDISREVINRELGI